MEKISLAIFGNQISNSGFQPLYWLNNPPQQLENIVPPGMDENLYFFTMQILPEHTCFTLINNRVSSYMSVRPGVLKMEIAIPRGYRLANDVSPMDVLLNVRRKFFETNMTPREQHSETYNFNEKLVEPDVFLDLLDAYALEEAPGPRFAMRGTDDALLLLPDEDIALLFRYPQRSEFKGFRRIVIANKGNAAAYNTVLALDAKWQQTTDNGQRTTDRSAMPLNEGAQEYGTKSKAPEDGQHTVALPSKGSRKNGLSLGKDWKGFLLAWAIGLVMGGLLVWLLGPSKDGGQRITDDEEMTEESEQARPANHRRHNLEDKYRALIEKPELNFEQVNEMAVWADSLRDHNLIENEQTNQLVKKIKAYKKLASLIAEKNIDEVFNMADRMTRDSLINDKHLYYIRVGWKKFELDDDGNVQFLHNDSQAKQAFRDNCPEGGYKSFKHVFDTAIQNYEAGYDAPQAEMMLEEEEERVPERRNVSAPKREKITSDDVR